MTSNNKIDIWLKISGLILSIFLCLLGLYAKKTMDLQDEAVKLIREENKQLILITERLATKIERNSLDISEIRGNICINEKMIGLLQKEIDKSH